MLRGEQEQMSERKQTRTRHVAVSVRTPGKPTHCLELSTITGQCAWGLTHPAKCDSTFTFAQIVHAATRRIESQDKGRTAQTNVRPA